MDSAQISKLPTAASMLAQAPAPQASDEIDLRKLLQQLWRRRAIILSTVVLVTLLVTIIVFHATPQYSATAKVMITAQRPQIVSIEEVMTGLGIDEETVRSEIDVITSRGLAEKVVTKLNLVLNPEFNPALRAPSWFQFDPMSYLPDSWREVLFGGREGPELTEEKLRARELSSVVNGLLGKIEVSAPERSRVISITVTTESAETAALVANTYADLYLVEQLAAKLDATRRATDWLGEQIQELRTKVEASESAVERFRREAGLIQGENFTTVTTQQISELNTQLVLARTERAEAEARLRQAEDLLRSERGIESAGEVLSSPLIQSLRQQQAEVQRKLADYSSQFGPRHPRMIHMQAEVADLRESIKAEINKIAERLRNDVAVTRARQASLEHSLALLEAKAGELNASGVKLRALEREAEANRVLFQTLLERMKETSAQSDIQQPDARLISQAAVPLAPSYPDKKLFILVGIFISLLIGVLLVFLVEILDSGFRSSEQVEDLLGVTALGLLPSLSRFQRREGTPESYVIRRPTSAYAEALRTLHTGVVLSDVDKPPKSILVTSAMPNEGKTSLCVSLARLMAMSGQRVLLIDADLRHPRVHKALGLANEPGIIEFLANELPLAEILEIDKSSGMHVLTAGDNAPNAPELLGSRRMQQALHTLSRAYDLIIIDSPPVLSVSDARVLCRMADRTIFVIRWADTRREIAMRGLKQIREAGGVLAGAVLSMVNVREHARYGYSDSGYYTGASRRYYTN